MIAVAAIADLLLHTSSLVPSRKFQKDFRRAMPECVVPRAGSTLCGTGVRLFSHHSLGLTRAPSRDCKGRLSFFRLFNHLSTLSLVPRRRAIQTSIIPLWLHSCEGLIPQSVSSGPPEQNPLSSRPSQGPIFLLLTLLATAGSKATVSDTWTMESLCS